MPVYQGTDEPGDYVIGEDGARPMTDVEARRARGVRTTFAEPGECEMCDRYRGKMCPPHDASARCESGKRSHCTCDTCF